MNIASLWQTVEYSIMLGMTWAQGQKHAKSDNRKLLLTALLPPLNLHSTNKSSCRAATSTDEYSYAVPYMTWALAKAPVMIEGMC